MEKHKYSSFTFSIVAIILGVVLYRKFDFETLSFEKPVLAGLYFIVFLFSIYILIKNYRKQPEK